MKKIFLMKLLFVMFLTISVNLSADVLKKDVNVADLRARMKEANYLDRDLRKDKRMYIKNDRNPFTGILVLRLGDYVEYTEAYKDGILSGDKVWYDSKGNIMMIETYVDGKINGEQITYYPSSKIRSVVHYDTAKITGVEWFNKNGRKIYDVTFTGGNGPWKTFFDDGKIHEEGMYKNYARDGVWQIYNEEGNLIETRTYRNGAIRERKWH